MPKAQLPLTPAPSAEIAALDKSINSPVDMYFALPPSAMPSNNNNNNNNNTTNSASAFTPLSPTSPEVLAAVAAAAASESSSRTLRQRSSAKRPAADFTLPPPPTRTRKIIQVKPKGQELHQQQSQQQQSQQQSQSQSRATAAAGAGGQAKNGKDGVSGGSGAADGGGGGATKKKPASATTAAGRKIARRTAHSLIERRRRSKMNEEFATLKNMIPACKGQEMHKLAILQASIEYVNYLEKCLVDLKAANNNCREATPTSPTWKPAPEPRTGLSSYAASPEFAAQFDSLSSSHAASPHSAADLPPPRASFEIIPMILPSPALAPARSPPYPPRVHRDTFSSTTSTISSLSTASSATSPVVIPQQQQQHEPAMYTPSLRAQGRHGSGGVAAAAAAASVDVDMDREATAALLMLNIDRRTSSGVADLSKPVFLRNNSDDGGKKGISVHDLLSH
ncbi:hypothetical protein LOZ66_006912 [Ophidiomyces ophidiicola]|nr:hypothetical protein LOZ66_006912 [Ophidiomyces ophidiicola]